METHEHIMAYYPLFEHMQSEHGLTLLESELQEIIRLSDEVKRLYNEASERSPFPSTESKCNKHIVSNNEVAFCSCGHWGIEKVNKCTKCGKPVKLTKQTDC